MKLNLSPEQTALSPYENLPLPENAAPLISVWRLERRFPKSNQFFYSICKEKGLNVSLIKDEGHNHFDIVNTLPKDSLLFKKIYEIISD